MKTIRQNLPPAPERILALPTNDQGYPVPYFVAWVDGKPDFRIADPRKFRACILDSRCWICGDRLGRNLAFVIGPMCALTRTTAEPPNHRSCAEWAVRACPFLANPEMRRQDAKDIQGIAVDPPGDMVRRNPGCCAIWLTRSYQLFPDHNRRSLIQVGVPLDVTWWSCGEPATREDVEQSIASGLRILSQSIEHPSEMMALKVAYDKACALLPG